MWSRFKGGLDPAGGGYHALDFGEHVRDGDGLGEQGGGVVEGGLPPAERSNVEHSSGIWLRRSAISVHKGSWAGIVNRLSRGRRGQVGDRPW